MKRALIGVLAMAAAIVILGPRGRRERPETVSPVFRYRGSTPVLQEMFGRLDADRDGKLSREEVQRVVAEARREPRDSDGDGFVTSAEFEMSFRRVYDWTPSDRSLLAFRYVIEGRRMLVDGFIDRSLGLARTAIQSFPEWADNWILYGDVLGRMGQIEESLAALRKAAELSPNYPAAWLAIAGGMPPRDSPPGPDSPLEKGLRLLKVKHKFFGEDPTTSIDSLWLERQLGHLMYRFVEAKQPRRAMELGKWARETIGPRPRLEGIGLLAQAHAGAGREALAEIQRRVETEPEKFYYLEFQARMLAFLQRPAEAIECYRRALALPGQPVDRRRMKVDRLILMLDTADPQAAAKYLAEIEPEVDTPHLKASLSRALARRGNPRKALELCRSAIGHMASAPPMWIELASMYGLLGDREGYVSALREALEKCPGPDRFHKKVNQMIAEAQAGGPLPDKMPEPGSGSRRKP